MRHNLRAVAALCAATALWFSAAPVVAAPVLTISRASLARTASFTVTTTLAPKAGSKTSQTMRVEVKGNKARLELNNPQIGPVTYLANEKGVFLYVPANRLAQRQNAQRNIDALLRYAFGEVNKQLKEAKRVGTARVSGQNADVYRDNKRGLTLYIGRNPAFRLPVKVVQTNAGGTRTFLVSNIKTNIALADSRFTLPPGAKLIEPTGAGSPGAMTMPGAGR